MMLVVDASAVTELALRRPAAQRVRDHLAGSEMHAPHLLDIEVISAVRHLLRHGHVTGERASAAVSDFLELSVERYPHAILGRRLWDLRDNFSPYDAVYLALAEELTNEGVPLLTTDARFARAIRKHTDVEVLLAA
jgi:predicted nucleic acid-binding protein